MHKIHNNILPSYFLNLFTTNLSNYGHLTRQASKLHNTPNHLNVKAYSIQVYGTKVRNSLSKDITYSTSLAVFKKDVFSFCTKPLKFGVHIFHIIVIVLLFLFCFALFSVFSLFSYYTFLLHITTHYTFPFSTVMYVIMLLLCCLSVQA